MSKSMLGVMPLLMASSEVSRRAGFGSGHRTNVGFRDAVVSPHHL